MSMKRRHTKEEENRKALFRSCRTGDLETLQRLLRKGHISLNITDEWDNRPLYLACLCGHSSVVQYLLQRGARYDATSIEGQRCFLNSLTQSIRDILRKYETSCSIVNHKQIEKNFGYFLDCLHERAPDFDIQLVADNVTFVAHKVMLAARSEYFRNVFKSGSLQAGVVDLETEFSVAGLTALLQYIYTGKVDVQIKGIRKVRKLFSYLGYDDVAKLLRQPSANETSHRHVQRQSLSDDLKKDLSSLVFAAVPPQFYYQLPDGETRMSQLGDPDDGAVGGARKPEVDFFSDIVFSVEGHNFQCHKVFFYGRSEYFRYLLIEKQADIVPALEGYRSTIKIEGVGADQFAQIVCFIYTDKCQITEDNCVELLSLAEKFVLPGLKGQLLVKVSSSLKPLTVSKVYQTARDFEIPKLQQKCAEFMADNIEDLCSIQQFRQLMKQEVLLSHSELITDVQYYIRKDCTEREEQMNANYKLEQLQKVLGQDEDGDRVAYLQVETGEIRRVVGRPRPQQQPQPRPEQKPEQSRPEQKTEEQSRPEQKPEEQSQPEQKTEEQPRPEQKLEQPRPEQKTEEQSRPEQKLEQPRPEQKTEEQPRPEQKLEQPRPEKKSEQPRPEQKTEEQSRPEKKPEEQPRPLQQPQAQTQTQQRPQPQEQKPEKQRPLQQPQAQTQSQQRPQQQPQEQKPEEQRPLQQPQAQTQSQQRPQQQPQIQPRPQQQPRQQPRPQQQQWSLPQPEQSQQPQQQPTPKMKFKKRKASCVIL